MDTRKRKRTSDEALIDRLVREIQPATLSGACRVCGRPSWEFGLAQYVGGRSDRTELCWLCPPCQLRLGGKRALFVAQYVLQEGPPDAR